MQFHSNIVQISLHMHFIHNTFKVNLITFFDPFLNLYLKIYFVIMKKTQILIIVPSLEWKRNTEGNLSRKIFFNLNYNMIQFRFPPILKSLQKRLVASSTKLLHYTVYKKIFWLHIYLSQTGYVYQNCLTGLSIRLYLSI